MLSYLCVEFESLGSISPPPPTRQNMKFKSKVRIVVVSATRGIPNGLVAMVVCICNTLVTEEQDVFSAVESLSTESGRVRVSFFAISH